jgi:plastocyanin
VKWVANLLALSLAAPYGFAGTVTVTARDPAGNAREDLVVWAMPKGASAPPRVRPAMVEQRDKTFIPLVTVIQAGTLVSFPNRDDIRHHVYSFSPAKRFEIKLYAGTPVDPIAFDRAGEVVLGCNIHDHMVAYVYVVETPWFGKTGKDGAVRIEGLPAGDYDINAWYYAQDARPIPVGVKLRADESATAAFTVGRRAMPPRPARK